MPFALEARVVGCAAAHAHAHRKVAISAADPSLAEGQHRQVCLALDRGGGRRAVSGEVAGVLPDVPVSVLGAAIGIYVSFRTNSAYDRWWEGRKLWGQLTNSCRHLTAEVLAYLPHPEQEGVRRHLIQRLITYVHVLRCELRRGSRAGPDLQRLVCEDSLWPESTTLLLRTQFQWSSRRLPRRGSSMIAACRAWIEPSRSSTTCREGRAHQKHSLSPGLRLHCRNPDRRLRRGPAARHRR